jgi:hypothetical protein
MFTDDAMVVFRRHHGMATARQLTAAGMSRRAREQAVADGLLSVLYERVFHITSSPLTLEARCAALCLAYARGFITGPTGGKLERVRRVPNEARVHFAVPHGLHIGPFPDVKLRQTTKVDSTHVVLRADGIRVAAPARLAFDLAQDLSAQDHRSVVEQLRKDGKVSVASLGRIGKQLVHPARPGSARFVATLEALLPGGPAESHPEVLIGDGLQQRGVPVERQVRHLQLGNGSRIRLDLAVPEVRWAVEVDVHPDHLLLFGTAKDKQRDRWCHRIDWQVERVTEIDLYDVDSICDELAENYRLRCEVLRLRR